MEEKDELQWAPEVDPPKEGMCFTSETEAYDYYKRYAASVGFGVRRSNTKVGEDRKVKYFSIACSRSRKPTSTSKSRKNSSIRTDCKAKINLIVDGERKLIVSKVRLDHNHALGVARSTREERNESNGGGGSADCQDAGCESSRSIERQFRFYIRNGRHLPLGVGDAEAIQDFFFRCQRKDANFFYVMDFNEEGRLRNLFWVDARSRAAYETFGDVVLFDTTYLMDKFNVPFAPFIGVNHHGQSVLLGCSLLSGDDTETYVWLFKSWLACMLGYSPKAVITDQCKSIQDAVSEVFPNARHRFCLWHILKKLPEKLGIFPQYRDIKRSFKHAIYESFVRDEFELNWNRMIENFNLSNNGWLQYLYMERHRWVPLFVRDSFWAGMSVTQRNERNESVIPFFDGYLKQTTSMKQFVEQYDNALRSKVEKETRADFAPFKTTLPLVSDLSIERQFREVYTHDIFKLFQEELKGLLYCNISVSKDDDSISTFEVTDSVKVKDDRCRKEVSFNVLHKGEGELQCTCRLFEFRGLICRHIIAVLMKKNVNEVPSCYILARWRKDVKHNYTLVKSSYDDFSTNQQMQRYDTLCRYFYQLAEIAAKSHAKCSHLIEHLDEAKGKLLMHDSVNDQPPQELSTTIANCDDGATSGIPNSVNWSCHSPFKKGHPPTKRKEVLVEQGTSKKKRKANSTQHKLTDLNTGLTGNQQHLFRYHYIQMCPDHAKEAQAKFGNAISLWQNSSGLGQPGRVGSVGSTGGSAACSGNLLKPHTRGYDLSQADPDVQPNTNLAVENPSDALVKL